MKKLIKKYFLMSIYKLKNKLLIFYLFIKIIDTKTDK
jgi:hypothetical protein